MADISENTENLTLETESVVGAEETPVPKQRNAFSVMPMTADVGDDEPPKATTEKSFGDTLYDAITEALGGNSTNQFLCLTLPGQSLTASDYSYAYDKKEPKGPTVEANESRLANKLFDPCRMVGSDNGLTLPYQYKSALDMLSPKLNIKIAQAKNSLRDLLNTPYPSAFGENGKVYTLQEVYFKLYDEWVAEERKWAEAQSNAKSKYGEGTDEYLEWYETMANSYLTALDEKMSKVISVFTPNDMKILEGILDSGSGAELQEARQTLMETRKRTPDGGYIYPVKFYPTNWFELLKTSFTPADLLKDPDVLAEKMRLLSTRRLELNAQIEDIARLIPQDTELTTLQDEVTKASDALRKTQNELIQQYGEGAKTVIDVLMDIASMYSQNKVPADIVKKLAEKNIEKYNSSTDSNEKDSLINGLIDTISTTFSKQSEYVAASLKLTQKAEALIIAKSLSQLSEILSPLKVKLEEITQEIDDLKTQIQISSAHRVADNITDNMTGETAVASKVVPEGYTRVYVSQKASSLTKGSSSQSRSSAQSYGVSFFFGGYHSESSAQSSAFRSFTEQSDSEIDVGMNVTKVGIERAWFNPGVFALTKDMFKLSTTNIAPSEHYTSVTEDRLERMASGNNIFPCYPTAMLIARDISIRFKFSKEVDSTFSSAVSSHSSSGGGFLFFSGSKSSSSSSNSSCVNMQSSGKTITLKFDTPQIIGYFLECTHADESVYIENANAAGDGYVSISQFVESYKKLLESRFANKQKKEQAC